MIKKVNDRKNILLVDDDHAVTQMLTMLFETHGYKVNLARNGSDCFKKISTSTDIIILDVGLPDYDGFDVCRRLKEQEKTRHIPIIILSGRILQEDIIEGLYVGADDYMTKPFEYEELVARMEAVMRRGIIWRDELVGNNEEKIIINELRKIIENKAITPYFQPIFDLATGEIYGVEALSRPQTVGLLSNPDLMFRYAVKFGFYQDLEVIAWQKAIQKASQMLTSQYLFLNCSPYFVEGTKFPTLYSTFDEMNIKHEKVILEITERSAIGNFKLFYKNLKNYRKNGFKFAIDDVGGGYASLESIVETKPEVVKIDRHITHNIMKDKFKRSIVRFIVAFCKENNIYSIAEGIESKNDYLTVKELGVQAGQGFYLHPPVPDLDLSRIDIRPKL